MNKIVAAAMTVAVAACTGAALAQAPKKDNPQCRQANPVFSKFPGSFTVRCEHKSFAKLDIHEAKDPGKPQGDYGVAPKEGEFWLFGDHIVGDPVRHCPIPSPAGDGRADDGESDLALVESRDLAVPLDDFRDH